MNSSKECSVCGVENWSVRYSQFYDHLACDECHRKKIPSHLSGGNMPIREHRVKPSPPNEPYNASIIKSCRHDVNYLFTSNLGDRLSDEDVVEVATVVRKLGVKVTRLERLNNKIIWLMLVGMFIGLGIAEVFR